MRELYQALAGRVDSWRQEGWPCEDFPAIAEILDWASDPDSGTPRYLRLPQLRALETYWYLRLIERTPHVFDLYQHLFQDPSELLQALHLDTSPIRQIVTGKPLDVLWEKIREDDAFVAKHKLHSVRETLTLAYPSYILALAMGSGKTVLIGAIFATEFGMALDQPEGPFVQNALVFAPGRTIIESLRELLDVRYERILPPRLFKSFSASAKITFTRDGDKDIPVVRGSLFNVIVTNTEKIRIQKEAIRKRDLGGLLAGAREEDVRAEVANLRLQAIASLPSLAVFSDEAHHTYGQSLETELKKVRRTVDYLAENTNVLVVVNTTGTPYFRKQPLRDVVVWYGLSQGIRDNILKDVSGNIQALELGEDPATFADYVVRDFFGSYGEVRLPNGAAAKLSIYFPQIEDLEETRPAIDAALASLGLSPALMLCNTSNSGKEEIDHFNRLNDPGSPYRVILLVNKGTEGWNCPSLFACALARKLRTSNNFVLQAATRCLRQVPGNDRKARIYLSRENASILDRQLQDTYGEEMAALSGTPRERASARLVLRKPDPPPLRLRRRVRTVVPSTSVARPLALERPETASGTSLRVVSLDIGSQAGLRSLLHQVGETLDIEKTPERCDLYESALRISSVLRLDVWEVYDELGRLYPEGEAPAEELPLLLEQAAEAARRYEVKEETAEWTAALVKPDAFDADTEPSGESVRVAEIVYPRDREHLLLRAANVAAGNPAGLGFHYDPYNFDSRPELQFYEQLLKRLNVHPAEVEDVYFTGGLSDPARTDFFIEYRGDDGRWHRYTPDFVIRKRGRPGDPPGSGRVLVVEIKSTQFEKATREDEHRFAQGSQPITAEGRKAVALRKLEKLNPDRLRYELIFAKTGVSYDQVEDVVRFVREPEAIYETDLEVAQRLCEQILKAEGPPIERVILFGSRARGDARPDSDYDILVVVEAIADEAKADYLTRLYRAVRDDPAVAEPWVVSRSEYDQQKALPGSAAHPAWAEGVMLYERS